MPNSQVWPNSESHLNLTHAPLSSIMLYTWMIHEVIGFASTTFATPVVAQWFSIGSSLGALHVLLQLPFFALSLCQYHYLSSRFMHLPYDTSSGYLPLAHPHHTDSFVGPYCRASGDEVWSLLWSFRSCSFCTWVWFWRAGECSIVLLKESASSCARRIYKR